jgi:hypothetical protein
MTRSEYLAALNTVGDFGKNAACALKEFHAAHYPARDTYPDQEVERWIAGKTRAGERYTRSEVAEIRGQAAQQLEDERKMKSLVLDKAMEMASEKAAAIERHAEELRPDWQDVPDTAGDYARAMLRMADDVAVQGISARLQGASWTRIAPEYHTALERNDRITLRVIEELVGGGLTLVTPAKPTDADVVSLWHLSRAIREARRQRHPEVTRQVRETLNAIQNDPAVKRRRLQLVLKNDRSIRAA